MPASWLSNTSQPYSSYFHRLLKSNYLFSKFFNYHLKIVPLGFFVPNIEYANLQFHVVCLGFFSQEEMTFHSFFFLHSQDSLKQVMENVMLALPVSVLVIIVKDSSLFTSKQNSYIYTHK